MKGFRLGEKVWRVQGDPGVRGLAGPAKDSTYVVGPFLIDAKLERRTRTTYLLSWEVDGSTVFGTDEQPGGCLHRTKAGAVREANRQHNAWCERQKR